MPPRESALASDIYYLADRPRKYSHYNARMYLYEDFCVLTVLFRYHDPLPEGAVLRVVKKGQVDGSFGEGLVTLANREGIPEDMLSASIIMADSGNDASTLTIQAFAPDSSEPIFEIAVYTSNSFLRHSTSDESAEDDDEDNSSIMDNYLPYITPYFPLQDAIEEGMDLTPDVDQGFSW